MKNLTNVKTILAIIVMVAIMLISTSVFAEDSGSWADLSSSLNGGASSSASSPSPMAASGNTMLTSAPTSGNTTGNTTGTNTANTSGINLTNTLTSNTANTANRANTTNTANTSLYNSTNLPDTGLEDSLPVVVLIGVVGISAVYAYKKIKDYQNI